ncbi:GGDEF domain-containing protein, partial [Oceanospirillum sp. HFRX-1_2]
VIAAIWIGLDRFGAIAGDIRNLAVSVSQFTQGKRLPANTMKRDDEIGMLAHSFHTMQQQLFTDRLTGVANRSALEPFINRQIVQAKRNQDSVALLFIDLNKFKPLNDTWGHNNGDLALIETARRLESLICEQDFLARLGGDEFVIVLAAPSDRGDAEALATQITEIMSTPLTTLQNVPAHEDVYLGASVGIALYPEAGLDAESVMHHADQAMYKDKKNGGQQR